MQVCRWVPIACPRSCNFIRVLLTLALSAADVKEYPSEYHDSAADVIHVRTTFLKGEMCFFEEEYEKSWENVE